VGVGGPVVERVDVFIAAGAVFIAGDDGEIGLAAVVGQEEVTGGGGASPGAADGAAAKEGFWGEANEDLPDDDLLREAAAERRRSSFSCGLRHGRRRWGFDLSITSERSWCGLSGYIYLGVAYVSGKNSLGPLQPISFFFVFFVELPRPERNFLGQRLPTSHLMAAAAADRLA
jgi:hypothetical protein